MHSSTHGRKNRLSLQCAGKTAYVWAVTQAARALMGVKQSLCICIGGSGSGPKFRPVYDQFAAKNHGYLALQPGFLVPAWISRSGLNNRVDITTFLPSCLSKTRPPSSISKQQIDIHYTYHRINQHFFTHWTSSQVKIPSRVIFSNRRIFKSKITTVKNRGATAYYMMSRHQYIIWFVEIKGATQFFWCKIDYICQRICVIWKSWGGRPQKREETFLRTLTEDRR